MDCLVRVVPLSNYEVLPLFAGADGCTALAQPELRGSQLYLQPGSAPVSAR